MSDRKARIAFVGCGAHANNKLFPATKQVPELELAAVCDIDADRAQATAKRWGALATYTDLDEMLGAEELDAAVVCGSPQMHVALGQRVLEAGLHLYVEKPSAVDSANAQILADAARQAGRHGICGFMKRYAPAYRAAREILDGDDFGELTAAELRFTQGPYVKLWGIEEAMRAFLIGQVIHIFDLARFLGGDVRSVYAAFNQTGDATGAYAITLRYANGAVGLMNLNCTAGVTWHFDEYAHLSGAGSWLDVRNQIELTVHRAEGWHPGGGRELQNQLQVWKPSLILEHDALALGGYIGELQNLAQCALGQAEPIATLDDSAAALQLAEATWTSAQTGEEVPIPNHRR